ncbi:MAG TPA: aspartate--tRNA ligase [Clostridiaceae bacterium]|nr:aspartate--tRNA ligase [Clostridiaceae bacterium]
MEARSDYCGKLTAEDVGRETVLYGWCHKQRDLGGLIFITLRDRSGEVQLVADDTAPDAVRETAFKVRGEFVLKAKGVVQLREEANPHMKTGAVEVALTSLEVLGTSKTPPFYIEPNSDVNEALRLEYRFLDLRRPDMQNNMMVRHRVTKFARDFFDQEGFLEIETPMFIKSTPEGARDYLVPSRVFPGQFFALPQSPQLFKQLLMVAGYDRYMQIARCFRDEDLRADRQPEFTQIDVEMSFVDEDAVIEINERFLAALLKNQLDVELTLPLPRLTYAEAMSRFGSDKPDLRFGLELKDVSAHAAGIEFAPFVRALATGSVLAIPVPGGGTLSRRELDGLGEVMKTYGGDTFAWLVKGETWRGSVLKFFDEDRRTKLADALSLNDGDLAVLVADPDAERAQTALGAVRLALADKLNLIRGDEVNLLWVTDFPLFELDEEENRLVAKHHPFTSPKDEDIPLLAGNPRAVRAKAYDIIYNGNEIGGGSIRIHRPELQEQMFRLLGLTEDDAEAKFGFLLKAFRYGVPPHGGIAYGLDRLVMLLTGSQSIRDVIAFPKVQNSSDLMTKAPSFVDPKQLLELGIAIDQEKEGC